MENNTLSHHGIKGQKWGFRRFQNRDGTLTPAGKKRYAQEMERLKKEEKILKNKQRTKAQLDKLDAKRKEIEEQKKALKGKASKTDDEREIPAENVRKAVGKKKIKDMTDEELKAITDRLDLERKYKEAMEKSGHKVKDGKKFTTTLKDKAKEGVADAGKEIAKNAATSTANLIAKAIKESISDAKKKKK